MNTIIFDVYKNTIARIDGFNPVSSENNYSKILFRFAENDDWKNCSIITAGFFVSADNIIKSQAALMSDKLTATFSIPKELRNADGTVYVGLTGVYTDENGESVTIGTNIYPLDNIKGVKVESDAPMDLYEQLIRLIKIGITGNLTWVDVTKCGVKNDGTETSLSSALETDICDTVYYFPRGTYLCDGFKFNNANNVTFLLNEADIKFYNTNNDNILNFTGCSNIKIFGGVLDGKYQCLRGLSFVNSQYVDIYGTEIKNIGFEETSYAAGIDFVRDCSFFNIEKVKIHNVTAGQKGADGFIHCVGIGFNANYNEEANQYEYSKFGTIQDADIYNIIGTSITEITSDGENKTLEPDGDGIYIIQRPYVQSETVEGETIYSLKDEAESNIKIVNPHITNCSKRGIKVSSRAVSIEGAYIDTESWGCAVDFQFSKNCEIKNSFIRNKRISALAINYDDGNFLVQNCKLRGNMLDNITKANKRVDYGIVLNDKLTVSNENCARYDGTKQNVNIIDCDFDDVNIPIISNTNASKTKHYSALRIIGATIGHFSGTAAIQLQPSGIDSIEVLEIDKTNFRYGNTISEIFTGNNTYYSQNVTSGEIVNLGAIDSYINPLLAIIVKSDCINENFKELLLKYDFSAKKVDFGNLQYNSIFEKAPNKIIIVDGTYDSSTGSISAQVSNGNNIEVSVTGSLSKTAYIFVPITEIGFDNNIYNFEISEVDNISNGITITFADSKKSPLSSYYGIAANARRKTDKITGITGTAAYLRIKADSSVENFTTLFKVSLTDVNDVFKGNLLERIENHEEKISGKADKTPFDLFIIPSLVTQFGVKNAFKAFVEANADYDSLTNICNRFFKAAASAVTETYGTQFYRYNTSNSPLGTKIGDNAGLTCTPSTIAVPGTDDYADLPLFACFDINYIIDSVSLEPVIIAIKDVYGAFTSTPTESLVGVLQMTGWVRRTGDETTKTVEYRAQQANGFKPLPEGVKVDGSVRAFVIHAKYAAGYDANGLLSSVSGVQPVTLRSGSTGSTSISHDGQIAKWREWGAQYCGSSLCDIAFVQLMLEIKYAVLGSAQVMAGCRSYSTSYKAAVAENGVTRVLLTAVNAAYFVVGSCVSLGTANDRTKATAYDVCDITKIVSIEDVTVGDVAYKAINLETETTFNTTVDSYVIPQPWRTGSTDNVPGNDGSPTNNTSGKEPFKIQGIEVMLGIYEVPGGVKLYEDTEKYTVYAPRLAASVVSGSTVNDDYFILGTIPKEEAAAWKYNAELNWDVNDQDAYMLGQQFEGSSTTGYRSATYRDAAATVGWREWRAFSNLLDGGICGLACANLIGVLDYASWQIGARACGSGGNRGAFTTAYAGV